MRTLLIDNYDSFTYNLYQLLALVNGQPPIVVRNDEVEWSEVLQVEFDNIVISPGPGHPERERDFGISAQAILDSPVPVLGVCLGHQGICHLYGGRVEHAPEAIHGRLSQVYHNQQDILAGIPSPFSVVRYHSLAATQLSDDIEPLAWADGVLMAVRHRSKPIWGVQFHPESICTAYGQRLIENFRLLTEQRIQQTAIMQERRTTSVRSQPCYFLNVRKLPFLADADSAYANLFVSAKHSFWLDSSSVITGLSRFSFIGNDAGPYAEFVSYNLETKTVTIEGCRKTIKQQRFFDFLKEELSYRQLSSPELPFDFNLGYVGYLGYELKAECGGRMVHRSPLPDAAFIFADRMLVLDHQEKTSYLLCLSKQAHDLEAERWLDDATHNLNILRDRLPLDDSMVGPCTQSKATRANKPSIEFRHNRDTYLELIEKCKKEIGNGESYEICLTNMLSANVSIDPLKLYRHLRGINPAPYAAFLQFSEYAVLSSSPERFLSITQDGKVESKPIKGTRKRGATAEEDLELRQDLENSEKDRAENLMIVDLVRNDLSSVCEIGSVHVPRIFGIETYASVHQMVSTIRGTLKPGVSAADCVRAAFPGGSMTGAPKIRTMEIIDRLEAGSRGVYSGALGYFSLNGSVDLSIVIRTIVSTPDQLSFGVGGAIVTLSDADEEFNETMIKGRSMISAISASI